MTEMCELSFCELRAKEVVNSVDGRRLGRIIDIVFSSGGGEIRGIIVPYSRKTMFFKSQDVFIPWECVKKIGEDVIIVELTDFCGKPSKKHEPLRCSPPPPPQHAHQEHCPPPRDCPPPPREHPKPSCPPPSAPDCDRKCEKCMLFDCEYRWNDHMCGNGHCCDEGVYVDKNYKP